MMNKIKYFLKATRPKTLPASIIPVLIGSSIAYKEHFFNLLLFILTAICSILIQIITNYINEIYDFKRGADTKERLGPQRVVAAGLVSVKEMRNVSAILILITLILGLIIVNQAGLLILLVGILCLFFAYAYTGGPYPLAYNGLGDIFVFMFFGIVATCGAYFAQTGKFSLICLISSLPPGFLSMNILGVNNFRDIDTDKKAGKITMAVRIGKKKAQNLYVVLNMLSMLIPFALYLLIKSEWIFLPLLSLPLAVKLSLDIFGKKGKELNNVLAGTGVLLLLNGILTSVGFLIGNF